MIYHNRLHLQSEFKRRRRCITVKWLDFQAAKYRKRCVQEIVTKCWTQHFCRLTYVDVGPNWKHTLCLYVWVEINLKFLGRAIVWRNRAPAIWMQDLYPRRKAIVVISKVTLNQAVLWSDLRFAKQFFRRKFMLIIKSNSRLSMKQWNQSVTPRGNLLLS